MADVHPGKISTTNAVQSDQTHGEPPTSSGQEANESDRKARDEPHRANSSTVQEPPHKTSVKRAKPASLESCANLIRAVYSGKRKLTKPRKTDIDKMISGPKLQPAEREELLGLAAQDRTLKKTRDLMLLNMEFDGPNLAGQVRELVRDVLVRHPAFQIEALADALRNLPEGPTLERAVKILTQQSFDSLPWPEGAAVLKKSEEEKCRENAVHCLLLWYWETRGISFEHINEALRKSLWEPAAQRHKSHKSEVQKLRVLIDNRDPVAAAISCSLLKEVEKKARMEMLAVKDRLDALEGQLDAERTQVKRLEGQLDAERTQVKRLEGQLDAEQQAHKNAIAHRRNEYAKLRGRVLHRFRREVSLLEDGLYALRRTPPKVPVMEDHAERAIDGLKREMQALERGD